MTAQATNKYLFKSDELLDAGVFQFTNCEGKMFYDLTDVTENRFRNMGQ